MPQRRKYTKAHTKNKKEEIIMVDTYKIAYTLAAFTVTSTWIFLGVWFTTNLTSATSLTTKTTWSIFLFLWLLITIPTLSFTIRSLKK